MSLGSSLVPRSQVLIAGGGFGAVEAALALRTLAGERVQLTLISPDPVFRYRPAATLEAFENGAPRRYDLRAISQDIGARFHLGAVESVASRDQSLRTSSGRRLRYDALILATGARATVAIPGALTFRDQRDTRLIGQLLTDLETGGLARVLFVVPSGCTWPLPVYELALLCAGRARDRGFDVELSLVTPERAPLALFGPRASRMVGELLAQRGIRFVGASVAREVRRDRALTLQFDAALGADRVVAVPQLHGRRITGVPARWWGFVPTDAFGRVEGVENVYAAGDMTTFPIKQGGLAAQQADLIAQTIAGGLGAPVKALRARRVLQARLLGGSDPLILRAELDALGRPIDGSIQSVGTDLPGAAGKVFARYLTPYLDTREPLADPRPQAA